MPILTPYVPTPRETYQAASWVDNECYRFYVRERRRNCTFRELMDLWFRAPCCDQCIQSEVSFSGELPDITGEGWEVDMLLGLGADPLGIIKAALLEDPEFAPLCKRCHAPLCPWEGDDIYVLIYHLEEHYGIPMESPARQPSRRLSRLIISLYDRACFGCASSDHKLHIDHVLPRNRGGDAAFRNLQPLCEVCGNEKGDSIPKEVTVFSDIYFGPYPSDSYEGLFW